MVVAANRDEHYDRPSAQPALLQEIPALIAGKDLRVGGTWLGANEAGLVVGILNRRIDEVMLQTEVRRSRGLLCRDLLNCESAVAAAESLARHNIRYNPFTLVFTDAAHAFVAYNDDPAIVVQELASGLHVFSSAAQVELRSTKAERAHLLFAEVFREHPSLTTSAQSWVAPLQKVLADHSLNDGSDNPGDAICVHREMSGTVSSSIIFHDQATRRFETFHCSGAPCRNSFGPSLQLPIR